MSTFLRSTSFQKAGIGAGGYWRYTIIVALFLGSAVSSSGQCPNHVTHLSGTLSVGCTVVTVTPSGSAGAITGSCPASTQPYWIGCSLGLCDGTGSYTFVFSPPVSAVQLNFSAIDNYALGAGIGGEEEVSVEVNGVHYAIPAPGTPNCSCMAVLTPSGNIAGCFACGCASGWDGTTISGPISSLQVTNTLLGGNASGSIFSLYICPYCCITDAGHLTSPPLNVCTNLNAVVPAATLTLLEPEDRLQYILFSDPADTLGSIVATSNIPQFSFNPALMQTETTYYIAAIAGDNLSGNVDLIDPCLDISNGISVIWHAPPTVTFTATNLETCPGSCQAITANFTGTPPFLLQYQSGTFPVVTQSFPELDGAFQICLPLGTPIGSFLIHAVSLTDHYCTCH